MRTIEIAGPVGAGKSSLVEPLHQALLDRGLSVSRLDELVQPTRGASLLWSLAFALRHPRLAVRAIRALLAAPIPWWHRRLILGLVLGVGGRLMAAGRLVGPDHWVIVDEGLVHRAVNLFAWRQAPPAGEVAAYLSSVPLRGPLLVVNASPEAAQRRAERRGMPKRLSGRSEAEVTEFVGRARDVVLLAADLVQQRGVRVVRVDNRRSLRRAVAGAVEAIAPRRRSPRPEEIRVPPYRPRYPMLPRPDRLLQRAVARRRPGLSRPLVEELLAAYDLAPIARPRAVTSPGGRGLSMRIRTAGGEVILKRYKAGVSPEAIAVEHSTLRELQRLDLPAPRVRATRHGSTCVQRDDGAYALFDYLPGYRHPHEYVLPGSDRHRLQELAGTLLADLHLALAGHQPPASDSLGFTTRSGPRVRPVEWYTKRLTNAPAPRRVRAWVHGSLWQLWETLNADDLPRTVVHGDYGPYNLLLRPGVPPVVIDWELARIDWRLVDLATCLPRFARRRTGFDPGAARRVLGAYRQQGGIAFAEVRRIPEMLAFLSLQRAVVSWGRAREPGGIDWEDEARQRVMLAEDLLDGRHPLCALVRS